QAAGAATVWTCLHVDHVAKAPFETNAGKEIDIVGERWRCRLQDASFKVIDLVLTHERDSIGTENAHAAERTTLHQHADKGQIVRPGRINPTPAGEGLPRCLGF